MEEHPELMVENCLQAGEWSQMKSWNNKLEEIPKKRIESLEKRQESHKKLEKCPEKILEKPEKEF